MVSSVVLRPLPSMAAKPVPSLAASTNSCDSAPRVGSTIVATSLPKPREASARRVRLSLKASACLAASPVKTTPSASASPRMRAGRRRRR